MLPNQTIDIQTPFQYPAVVDHDAAAVAAAKPLGNTEVAGEDGQSLFEEKLGADGTQEKRIVVE